MMAMRDPEDETRCMLGLEKSNLGSTEVPTFAYRIVGQVVASTDEGDVTTGKVHWLGRSDKSVSEALASSGDPDGASASSEAAGWLHDYLVLENAAVESATVKKEARRAGHSEFALRAARKRLKIVTENVGFPRRSVWKLPGAVVSPVVSSSGETLLTTTTTTTGPSGVGHVGCVGDVDSPELRTTGRHVEVTS
jgi:hypothetical protein